MPKRILAFAGPLLLIAAAARASDLAPAMREVERLRGVTFLHDVERKTIDRKDLREVLRREIAKSLPYSTEDYLAVLRAMQLVDASQPQLIEKLLDLYESQVLAFYDPMSHTYFAIRQMPPALAALGNVEVLTQSVVVHELTHALQDQRVGASRRDLALRRDADGQLAYHALLEGEASLVMLAWLLEKGGQSLEEVIRNDAIINLAAAANAAENMIDGSAPPYFVASLKFPYIEGLRLVVGAYRRGGWKEVDRMHANPPRTTREILNSSEYFARLASDEKHPDFPAARSTSQPPGVRSVEHLGEFHWRFLVGDDAAGWVDDRSTVRCDDLVHVETWWESRERAEAFREAYVKFLRDRGTEPRVRTEGTFVDIVYLVQ